MEETTPLGLYAPPHLIEAEQAVLSAMLTSSEDIETALTILRREDFYRDTHRILWDRILSLYQRDVPVDHVNMLSEVVNWDQVDTLGGRGAVTAMFNIENVTFGGVEHHARIVRDKAITRTMIEAGMKIASLGRGQIDSIEEAVGQAEQIAYGIRRENNDLEMVTIAHLGSRLYGKSEEISEQGGKMIGLSTGFSEIDRFTQGLKAKEVSILAARPSLGKTALSCAIAMNVAQANEPVFFISAEMSSEGIGKRFYSALAGIESARMERGDLTQGEWIRYSDAVVLMEHVPLEVTDAVDNVPAIHAALRRFIRKYGRCALVVVDYLTELQYVGRRVEGRRQEVESMIRALKRMCIQTGCHLMVLSQLTRSAEGKEPTLADLMETGAIEASADLVLFLHRERFTKDAPRPKMEPTLVIAAKHRNGPTGRATIGFMSETASYVNPEFRLEAPPEAPRNKKPALRVANYKADPDAPTGF